MYLKSIVVKVFARCLKEKMIIYLVHEQQFTPYSSRVRIMSGLTRYRTAESITRSQIVGREWRQRKKRVPCPADHKQHWQPYTVNPNPTETADNTYHTSVLKLCTCMAGIMGRKSFLKRRAHHLSLTGNAQQSHPFVGYYDYVSFRLGGQRPSSFVRRSHYFVGSCVDSWPYSSFAM